MPPTRLTDYDDVRAANPDLVVNLYAMEIGGPVTLEILTPDGKAFTFTGRTARDAIAKAFSDPSAPDPTPDVSEKPTDDEPQTDVFS